MITGLLPKRTEVSPLVTGSQAVVAEMTTAATDLLGWQKFVISPFEYSPLSIIYIFLTEIGFQ
jgi:hypothetical protein